MGILDTLLTFSLGQTLVAAAGAIPSTDVVDFGLGTAASPQIPTPAQGGGARDMGIGHYELKLLVQVGTTLASAAGTVTLTVALQGAPDDGTGVPGAYATWWTSPAYTVAQVVAGARLLDMDFPRPPQGVAVPRFVRLLYTTAVQDATAGTIGYAGIVLDRDDQMYNATDNSIQGGYRAGITVAN